MKIQVTSAVETYDKDIIETYRDKTEWFNPNNPLSRRGTFEMFRSCNFGIAESLVLVAALGLIGVSFDDDTIVLD